MAINNRNARMLSAMRNLRDKGFTDEDVLVSAAADTSGGDDAAMRAARRVYDQHFKIFTAN